MLFVSAVITFCSFILVVILVEDVFVLIVDVVHKSFIYTFDTFNVFYLLYMLLDDGQTTLIDPRNDPPTDIVIF